MSRVDLNLALFSTQSVFYNLNNIVFRVNEQLLEDVIMLSCPFVIIDVDIKPAI